MPRVTFIPLRGPATEVSVPSGTTVLEAAKANGVDLPGTCGASLVCGTCHVFIDATGRATLKPPSEDEEDTLDLAFGVTAESRLGCQVVLTDKQEGIRIRLAPSMHESSPQVRSGDSPSGSAPA